MSTVKENNAGVDYMNLSVRFSLLLTGMRSLAETQKRITHETGDTEGDNGQCHIAIREKVRFLLICLFGRGFMTA